MAFPPRFLTGDSKTFGGFTSTSRWPTLVQNMIDDLDSELSTKIKGTNVYLQGQIILKQLLELKQEIKQDKKLRSFTEEEIRIAQVPLSFNEYLSEFNDATWQHAEWLFTEVYLYRRVNVYFRMQSLWYNFDIFNKVKQHAFHSSYYGVIELAIKYQSLETELENISDPTILKTLFEEFIEISLWGNATDLSLLTNVTLEDIKSLQGEKTRADSRAKILVNDSENAWELLFSKTSNKQEVIRVDFVLDNSGFELYADLMLASFLLKSKLATKCIFHCKDIPYMVSDVMLKDFDILVKDLQDRKFFPIADEHKQHADTLDFFAKAVTQFVTDGSLEFVENSFWTCAMDYTYIDPSEIKYNGDKVHADLLNSDLVIFKGDLNYRKLTGDRTWKRTTPWPEAIGSLASSGVTTLSLRTCKADVQVALDEGVDEKLSALWEKDHPNQGSWWCCSGKYAVICYCDGKQ
ncbi:hypothetical protein TPHA_0C02710 [Tetrapisispora phaffii CBS 4417]|uniref:Sugar phosphate phosphatase n=1 Tax=Tetrapisispora phaffii (strain ATCC 24235 / CBS 4417 / NBRC 1672 / NRRL Y-8282 / UCD 70-5) TaxID=1071381 RepID=G8BRP8_TETPH|nr:hypothetical protein TPHA_0C02710 [Tetrapisispora phaffii CBS 4417]CCE62424.1 hypothetical protein TPHA_0C02710 [Tetrapisispora phaffii CBS 4417]